MDVSGVTQMTSNSDAHELCVGFASRQQSSSRDYTMQVETKQNHVGRPYDFCLHSKKEINVGGQTLVMDREPCPSPKSSNLESAFDSLYSGGTDHSFNTDPLPQTQFEQNQIGPSEGLATEKNLTGGSAVTEHRFKHTVGESSVPDAKQHSSNEFSISGAYGFVANDFDAESQDSTSQDAREHSFLRKELLAALSHDADEIACRAATPDTDTLSMGTTTSFEAEATEDDAHAKYNHTPTKAKQGRRTKKWLEDDDKEPLSYELKIGVRILGEFMVEANKSLTWPFMNRVDAERDGVPDYYDVIKQPVWFNGMKEKFVNRKYSGIDEFVSDFRTMLQNCYRYNGPDHPISKKAQRLETMLEQKLSLLSRELRERIEKCSVASSAVSEKVTGSRRRRQIIPHDSTALLNQLRLEQIEREKEARKVQMEEKKLQQEAYLRGIDEWEAQLFTEHERRQMKSMHELPQIGHFLFLCQGPLNIGEIAQWELERCFLMPKESNTMQKVMTSLLSTPYQRARFGKKPFMPYSVWEEKLRVRSRQWYKVLKESAIDVTKAAEKLGIEDKFFKVLGLKNPLEKRKFHELTYYQRVWIVKNLCDWCLENQESLREAIEAQPDVEQHEYILGEDASGSTYIHFPQFCGADLRVYRHTAHEMPTLDIPKPSPVKKAKKSKQRLSVRWAAARRKLLSTHAKLLQSPVSSQSKLKQVSPRKSRLKMTSRRRSDSGRSENSDTDSGISDSDSDFRPHQSRSKRSPRMRSRAKADGRQSSYVVTVSGDDAQSEKRLESSKVSPGRLQLGGSREVAPGRVTRSAWKKSIQDITDTLPQSRTSPSSRISRRKQNKNSPSPGPSPHQQILQDEEKQKKTDPGGKAELRNGGKGTADSKMEGSIVESTPYCIDSGKTDNDIESQSQEEMDSNSAVIHTENRPNSRQPEKRSDKLSNCDSQENSESMNSSCVIVNIPQANSLPVKAKTSDNQIKEEERETSQDISAERVNSDTESAGSECAAPDTLKTPSISGSVVTCDGDASVLSKEEWAKQNADDSSTFGAAGDCDVRVENAPDSDVRKSKRDEPDAGDEEPFQSHAIQLREGEPSAVPAAESAESLCTRIDTVSDGPAHSEQRSKSSADAGRSDEVSVSDCSGTEEEAEMLDQVAFSDETTQSGDEFVKLSDSVNNSFTASSHVINFDSAQLGIDARKEDNSVPENQAPENSYERNEVAQIMMSMSALKDVQKRETEESMTEAKHNVKVVSDEREEEMRSDSVECTVKPENNEARADKEETLAGKKMKSEPGESDRQENEISPKTQDSDLGKDFKSECAAVDDKSECAAVDDKSDVNKETREEGANAGSGDEEIESDLGEPEITEPHYSDFRLVCETVEELRVLTQQFSEPEVPNTRSDKKRKGAGHSCEKDLYARLAFLLKELEPWESKLLQANRRMKAKMKREQENYVEEAVKHDDVWESEPSSSEQSDGSNDNDSSPEYLAEASDKIPALRPRRKKPTTPNPDTTQDIYMDQSEEYGYSSMGRKRKRRIIPNNAEDQGAPKKTKPARNQKKVEVPKSIPARVPRSTVASLNTQSTARSAHSPSKMQHLIFQQSDGRRFTISDSQTLLLRAPSASPGGPTQLIQIPGSVAIRNPGLLTQFLSSGKLGPGTAAILVQNQETSNTAQLLKQHLANRSSAQPQGSSQFKDMSQPSFPAFQFKSSASLATQNVSVSANTSTEKLKPVAATVAAATISTVASLPGITHSSALNKAKHTPRILVSPKQTPANKPVQYAQLLNQLPANVLAQLGVLKQQAQLQAAVLPNQPVVIQNQTAVVSPQATLFLQTGANQFQTATTNLATDQHVEGLSQGQMQGHISIETPQASGAKPQGPKTKFLTFTSPHKQETPGSVAVSGSAVSPLYETVIGPQVSPVTGSASSQQRAAVCQQRPKYSSNVTVKELLERQLAGQVAQDSGQSPDKSQGDFKSHSRVATAQSGAKTVTSPFTAGDMSCQEAAVKHPQTVPNIEPLLEKKTLAPRYERSDTREAAEALISLEAAGSTEAAERSPAKLSKQVHTGTQFVVKENLPSLNTIQSEPSYDKQTPPSIPAKQTPPSVPTKQTPPSVPAKQTPPSVPIKQTPPSVPAKRSPPSEIAKAHGSVKNAGGVQKVAVLAKTPQGTQSIKMVSADKLQELIARKEAVDNAVKQVITEVPTTLPTVQIKVSSPFALTSRQKQRPCTAATMALKHPIPAVPPIPALNQSRPRTSVSASIAYDVTSYASAVAGVTCAAAPRANLEALPMVTSAPTALVSVKTTPVIHSTEAGRVSQPSSGAVLGHTGTVSLSTKPQTVQVAAAVKNSSSDITAKPSLQKAGTAMVLQQSATPKHISPKGFNVAKLKEQGLVLVKNVHGQLQLMKTSQVAAVPKSSASTNHEASRTGFASSGVMKTSTPVSHGAGGGAMADRFQQRAHVSVSVTQATHSAAGSGAAQDKAGGSEPRIKSPPLLIQPKVAVSQSELQAHGSAQSTLVLQPAMTTNIQHQANVSQSVAVTQSQQSVNQIQPAGSQTQQSVTQIQQPRLVLQPPSQLQQSAVNQVQQSLAGAVSQLQQPRLVLVNVNGQLVAQAVPQVNLAGAGVQLVNPSGGGLQLVQQPTANLVQPGIPLAPQPVTLTNQATVAGLQLSQQPSVNIVRPVMMQNAGLQSPLAMVQGGIQGSIMVPGANIQGSVAMLQASGVQSNVIQGPVLQTQNVVMPMGLLQQPVASSPLPTTQVMVNLSNVFQTQK